MKITWKYVIKRLPSYAALSSLLKTYFQCFVPGELSFNIAADSWPPHSCLRFSSNFSYAKMFYMWWYQRILTQRRSIYESGTVKYNIVLYGDWIFRMPLWSYVGKKIFYWWPTVGSIRCHHFKRSVSSRCCFHFYWSCRLMITRRWQ